MKIAGAILGVILVVIALIAIAFTMELGGLQWAKFFNPRKEAVRRDVFKQTRSFNESKTQDLARFRLQYMEAEGGSREALASTIRIMFADYDRSLLPNELAAFLYQIRGY